MIKKGKENENWKSEKVKEKEKENWKSEREKKKEKDDEKEKSKFSTLNQAQKMAYIRKKQEQREKATPKKQSSPNQPTTPVHKRSRDQVSPQQVSSKAKTVAVEIHSQAK